VKCQVELLEEREVARFRSSSQCSRTRPIVRTARMSLCTGSHDRHPFDQGQRRTASSMQLAAQVAAAEGRATGVDAAEAKAAEGME